ncbi:ArsR/SmtB family transcription factor [Nakamurella aerolata]|uniref:Helix-turn-helix transcriptional regulator n=1 Tax=Nakamurella aerolata TaxID=1656892 RepID=A0A849AF74_9ACTN|nr:helix-turn-helix transcriptional regulator [Nakamurella aerolata]NNG37120.1 helix-turn-helix transcriptional regulator [Nakamurella aerolata]
MPAKIPSRVDGGEPDIAKPAELIGHPARAAMLMALLDGRSLPMTRLAHEAGVAASTASAHLARLQNGGLVQVRQQGRHRYFAISNRDVAAAVEALARLSPIAPVTSLRAGTRSGQLRFARSCFDHLAGRLGTAVMGSLIDRGYIVGGNGLHDPGTAKRDRFSARGKDIEYALSDAGERWFTETGALPTDKERAGRRAMVCYCVDWTEQRHHLAGIAGDALLTWMLQQGWLRRSTSVKRAIRVTPAGHDALISELGVDTGQLGAA